MTRRGRICLSLLLVAALVAPALLAPPGAVAATNDTIRSFSLSGTPFAADFAPLPQRVTLELDLARKAKVWVSIRRPDGTLVRWLANGVNLAAGRRTWTWAGINKRGRTAADGQYLARVVTENGRGRARADRPLRKGLPPIYPANPGAIVIAVDPGHGGRYPGAVRDGFLEKDFNLAISLQLQQMLERAGVQVVMSRTTDRALDEPRTDHNGDGLFNRYDDDMLRTDSKNLARADVAVHVHNNANVDTEANGTSVYFNSKQTWAPQAAELAAVMLDAEMDALNAYRAPTFTPQDNGVRTGWYYYLGPYDPPFLPRPSLVTSVLSESLFVSNTADLEALKRADVRQSIAAGIYVGLAEWLNEREWGAGYATTAPPTEETTAGSAITYHLRLTNRGNRQSEGWTLQLGAVAAVPVYDGSGAVGQPIGEVAVPDGLNPGESVVLDIPATAPAAGEWLIKADVAVGEVRFSELGIAALQVPLTTTTSEAAAQVAP